MGNQGSQALSEDINVLLVHFPPLSTLNGLSSTKLFKSAKCTDQQNVFFSKVFSIAGIPKETYKNKLESINSILNKIPHSHILSSLYMETENLGLLYRPFIHSSLIQKIIRPPFLNIEEKKWIAYQMLKSVKQLHSNDLVHGDIRPENYLLTSWNWIYLSDIAFYKPSQLPEGDMTSYTLFFSPGNREACYLAPERFSSKGKDALELKSSMDIFSLGCVITELFLDGAHLFTLPQLLSYKKNETDMSNKLNQLVDNVKEVILQMIKVDPLDRWNINQCIEYWEQFIIPKNIYSRTYEFCASLSDRYTSDEQVLAVQDMIKNIEIDEYSVIFCSIIGSLIRNVSKPDYKILSIKLMTQLAFTDDVKLHRVLPFFLTLLNKKEERSTVKSACLHNIAFLLSKVQLISAKDTHLFKEYIWPLVSICKNDESEWVRYTLADLMPKWGFVARRLLELGKFTCKQTYNFDKTLGQLGYMVGSIYNDLLNNREDSAHLILLSNFPYFVENFSDEVARTMFREAVLPWFLKGDKYQIAILQEARQYIKVLGGYFFKHAFKHLENNFYGHSELLVFLTLKTVNYHVRMNTDLLEKTLQYLLHPNTWIRCEMQKLIIEILSQLDPTMNFSIIRPMIIPYLLLHPSQVLIIDKNTIMTHLYKNVRRSVFNMMIAGKKPELLAEEDQVLGNIKNLIEMIGLPVMNTRVPSIIQEPDDKIQTDIEIRGKKNSSGSFGQRSPTVKVQAYEGLGLVGELEWMITSHESPVTQITPVLENFLVSASQDGKMILWKLNKFDDYSKIKYREIKKTLGMKPIRLGCCGDFLFVGYKDVIRIWDRELTQIEGSINADNITEVTDIDNNTIIYTDMQGKIMSKDFREEGVNELFNLGAQKGIISAMTKVNENIAALGTISGHFLLFDLRFCIPSACYVNSYKQPIMTMCAYNCKYKPLIDGSQLLTSLASEIVMWDLNTSKPSVFFTKKTQDPLQVPYLTPEQYYYPELSNPVVTKSIKDFESSAFFEQKLERLEQYTKISSNFVTSLTEFGPLVKKAWETRSNILKILVPLESNLILSTGEDALVRIWDPISPKASFLIGQGVLNKPEYHYSFIPDLLVIQEQTLPPFNIKKKRRDFDEFSFSRKISHSHAINDMAYVNQPKPLLFTGSNDGTIRIWR